MQEEQKPIPPQEPIKEQEPEPSEQPLAQPTVVESQVPQQPPEVLNEKKELFRREDVRTMRKDLNRLLEEEAEKERERISKLKTAEEIKKEQERMARLRKEEEERIFTVKEEMLRTRSAVQTEEQKAKVEEALREEALAKEARKERELPKPAYRLPFPLPPKPSFIDKLFSRWVALGLMVAFWGIVITFWYWYLVVRPKTEQPLPPQPKETQTPQVTPPEELPTPSSTPEETPQPPVIPPVPESFIPMNQDVTVEFSSEEELPQLFSQAVQQYRGEDVFTRIIIRNLPTNSLLSLPDFSRIFKIKTPEGFLEKLSPEATFFVYSSLIANRFGFATQIVDPENFEEMVRSWEPNMEQDTEYLFSLLGKKEPSSTPKFRQAVYKNIAFRYISFPSINFGIVWSIISRVDPQTKTTKYYFVLTSSGESMFRVIDRFLQ